MLSNSYYYHSEDLLLGHPINQTVDEDNEVALRFCSPERPSPRLFVPLIATSPAPDSELNIITSQGGLNASIEYNISDEDNNKSLFDTSLPPFKWPLHDSIPLEDFPMLPKINIRHDWQPPPRFNYKSKIELSMPQPIHRTRSLFQEPTRPISQFSIPFKKSKPLGTLDNPIVLDDDDDNLGFVEVKGKYQVLDKIGEGGLRHNDQVTLVLPYFEHDKFKDYLFTMTCSQIKSYMRALFVSLQRLHNHQIIHRDVKPGNFLYNIKKNEFMLVDFGLAQLQSEMTPPSPSPPSPNGSPPIEISDIPPTKKRASPEEDSEPIKKFKSDNSSFPVSPLSTILEQPHKKAMQAPRAGTRGFRAPEVLLKYPYQTVAIDIWSAGIVFLCMLSMRYPFFNSPDDLSALAEIAAICGTKEITTMAMQLGRKVVFPVDLPKQNLKLLCQKLSGNRVTVSDNAYDLLGKCLELHPNDRITAADALQHPFFKDSL